MGKVTMQDIADALSISRVSVWKVFHEYPGVSSSLKNKILMKAEELGYSTGSDVTCTQNSHSCTSGANGIVVSVVVSRPDTSIFWTNIIHQIAKELAQHDISLIYTYLPDCYTPGYQLPDTLTGRMVQSIIMLNVYDAVLFRMLNQLSIPKVFLDSIPGISDQSLTGDLVLLEGQDSIYEITSFLIEKGRTNIGFIGATNYARTNLERYHGYAAAMNNYHLPFSPANCLTGDIGINTYREEIFHFLDSLTDFPDAFVCVSDFVANLVIQYAQEHNIGIPDDLAVSGYDGNNEYGNISADLTTVQIDTSGLGKRLVHQLLYRMENPDASQEIVYLRYKIFYGKTTDFH